MKKSAKRKVVKTTLKKPTPRKTSKKLTTNGIIKKQHTTKPVNYKFDKGDVLQIIIK